VGRGHRPLRPERLAHGADPGAVPAGADEGEGERAGFVELLAVLGELVRARRPSALRVRCVQRPGRARELDEQMGVAQLLDDVASPFDDHDRVREIGVEVEVVDVRAAAQPVGVHVHEGGAAHLARVDPGDHEGRGGDGAAHAQPFAETLGEGGLAGAERSVEHEQVARTEEPGEPAREIARAPGAARGEGERGRLPVRPGAGHQRCSRGTRLETEVRIS
jgi:hypothetical protein